MQVELHSPSRPEPGTKLALISCQVMHGCDDVEVPSDALHHFELSSVPCLVPGNSLPLSSSVRDSGEVERDRKTSILLHHTKAAPRKEAVDDSLPAKLKRRH